MKDKKLGILISTIDAKIVETKNKMLPQLQDCDVYILHQITDPARKPEIFAEKNVKYLTLYEKGLSKSRNKLLEKSQSEINLIADDDLVYLPGFVEKILSTYEKYPKADLVIFKTQERSKKSDKVSWCHKYSIVGAVSFTISFKKSSLDKFKVRFDERFGLGAKYGNGEENIFLKDCLESGMKILDVNIPIVSHSHPDSGVRFEKKEAIETKVAVFWRMYGPIRSFLSIFYFAIFKHRLYKNNFSFWQYIRIGFRKFFGIVKRGL